MFRLYNSHHQANVKHSLGTYNVQTLWDPISIWDPITCAHYMYPSYVLRWHDDGCNTAGTRHHVVNTFAASYLNTQGLNNSCLKSPASTLLDLTFQSRALRSFSLNQLHNLSL